MTTRPITNRYGARDAVKDRTALDRACSAACRRLALGQVQLTFTPRPAKRRWRAVGLVDGAIAATGSGSSADEAVAALTAVVP